jgi:hypothetical protein
VNSLKRASAPPVRSSTTLSCNCRPRIPLAEKGATSSEDQEYTATNSASVASASNPWERLKRCRFVGVHTDLWPRGKSGHDCAVRVRSGQGTPNSIVLEGQDGKGSSVKRIEEKLRDRSGKQLPRASHELSPSSLQVERGQLMQDLKVYVFAI